MYDTHNGFKKTGGVEHVHDGDHYRKFMERKVVMEEKKKKYSPGMSPEEFSKAFADAAREGHEEMQKLPVIFENGEHLDEVVTEDLGFEEDPG